MDRRDFIKLSLSSAAFLSLEGCHALSEDEQEQVGKAWKGWKKGHFQIHFIYTGVSESLFLIFPDGTSMLLDCGDYNQVSRTPDAVPVLPNPGKGAGEWIARYVLRVNPNKENVDYMMLSHYHSDHCGTAEAPVAVEKWNGEDYWISGFTQAAKFLKFKKGIDRCWPEYNDPYPLTDDSDLAMSLMKKFYSRIIAEQGATVEKFELGSTTQIHQEHSSAWKDFTVRNITANGRICGEDGVVHDLYAERLAKDDPGWLNENGMSLGMIITYGDFRFYTAGDFSDGWKLDDGTMLYTENELAKYIGKVNVAKTNHHCWHSMHDSLVASLRAQAYVTCVWNQQHDLSYVMDRLANRETYPEDRYLCPTLLPAERRAKDEGKAWLNDVPKACYEGTHIIVDVEPGGKRYTMNFIGASDEEMTVKQVIAFKTK